MSNESLSAVQETTRKIAEIRQRMDQQAARLEAAMTSYTVSVTWMDGKQDTFFATEYPQTDKNGAVLRITERYGVTGGVKNESHLTVANIRYWKADPR